MSTTIPTIGQRRCLDEALRLLQEKQAPAIAVVDSEDRFVGLISAETVGELMLVREAMPRGARIGPWSRPARA